MLAGFLTVYLNAQKHYENHKTLFKDMLIKNKKSPNLIWLRLKQKNVYVYFSFRFYTDLAHVLPVWPSYRNQSTDLLRKSIDWFLHEGNVNLYWVKYSKCIWLYYWLSDEHFATQNTQNMLQVKNRNCYVYFE